MAAITQESRVFLSVGSNLGDKLDNCLQGLGCLSESGKSRLLRTSRFYRTSPVDYTDQAWFVNAAVEIATLLNPESLLDELLAIQRRMGRKADAVRFGPRVIDLDILLFNEAVIKTNRLEIPHPRMHKRAFVLQPICDINPTVIHPVLGMTAIDLLNQLDDDDQQIVLLEEQPARPEGRAP